MSDLDLTPKPDSKRPHLALPPTLRIPHLYVYHPTTIPRHAPTIAAPIYPELSLAFNNKRISEWWTQLVQPSAKRTFSQNLHHLPASPPPSSASAAATHLRQFSPISPIIVISDMLFKLCQGDSPPPWEQAQKLPERDEDTHQGQDDTESRHNVHFHPPIRRNMVIDIRIQRGSVRSSCR